MMKRSEFIERQQTYDRQKNDIGTGKWICFGLLFVLLFFGRSLIELASADPEKRAALRAQRG